MIYFPTNLVSAPTNRFITGPQVRPYARSTQEPIRLLESITPLELANCVPFAKFTRVDEKTGREIEGSRSIMIDLAGGPAFGDPSERFFERSLVSLKNISIKSTLSYGTGILFKEIEIAFRVHRPDVVFNRESTVPWRMLLVEGESFVLEYGWSADPRVVKNDIFNGLSYFDPQSGLSIGSTSSLLMYVWKYNISMLNDGEMDVTVFAKENGERVLREVRLGTIIGGDDRKQQIAGVKRMVESLPRRTVKSRGELVKMSDVLDTLVAGPTAAACSSFGYSGASFFLGNFNELAGPAAKQYGGADMSGQSIGSLEIPAKVITKALSQTIEVGRHITLMNFVTQVVQLMNGSEPWATGDPSKKRRRPSIEIRMTAIKQQDGRHLAVIHVFDRENGIVPIEDDLMDPSKQTKENVFRKLNNMSIPILEFGKGNTSIIEASFELQPDPQLQGVMIDNALRDRKDRVQITSMPDVESRKGKSLPADLVVPISILRGSVTMIGNFVLETLGAVWVEFYGASQVSGLFRSTEKTDTIEPGRFRSTYELISEGADPLNTRRRRTQRELHPEFFR